MSQSPEPSAAPIKILGKAGSANAYRIRDFLQRSDVPFEWIELENHEDAYTLAGVDNLDDLRLPVCIFPDGSRLDCPNIYHITEKLGWNTHPLKSEYDIAIYGAGPAGLSAALYAASDGLKTVLVERLAVGGQAASTTRIENYLGFPEGISGADLAERARAQACKFGVEILLAHEGIRAEFPPGKGIVTLDDGTRIVAHASICATGVAYRRLTLDNASRLLGAGLFYGAGASEAAFTKGEDVYIVGGGNSAGQAAMHFAFFAKRVFMVIRSDSLRNTVSQYLVDRIRRTRNIHVLTNNEIAALEGDEVLQQITLVNRETGAQTVASTRWLFVCIGGEPQTDWADEVGVLRDESGYLMTGPDLLHEGKKPPQWPLDRDPYYLETSVPGVFAAGDVRHGSVKRCASAVGEGAMAVALAHRYLASC